MVSLTRTLTVVGLSFVISACNISVRNDVLLGTPLWESSRLGTFTKYAVADALKRACQTTALNSQVPESGLSRLAMQVLNEDVKRVESVPASSPCGPNQATVPPQLGTYTIEVVANNPLPAELAQSPVAKAFVEVILSEYETMGAVIRYKNGVRVVPTTEMKHNSLDRTDFKNFADLLIRTQWKPYQTKVGPLPYVTSVKAPGIPLQQILTSYLMEYYNGGYVDRYGVAYQKPVVGFSITNEVIVAVATIFQNALWDYVHLDHGQDVKAPMVYVDWDTPNNKPTAYVNATAAEPTFAKLIRVKNLLNTGHELPGIVEKVVAAGNQDGLTKNEVCVIHHMSGLSGEASEAITGMIVRHLGAVEGGPFVLFGKFSFGDHETLTKLIDAGVETFSRRSADLIVSHLFHKISYDQNYILGNNYTGIGLDWDWFKEHLKLADLLECLKKKQQ